MRNPYSALINHMRTQGGKNNTPYVQVGRVVTPEPLTLKLGDLQIGKESLLVADYLLPNYERKLNIPMTPASGNTTEGSISSVEVPDGDIKFTDGLGADDLVALISTLDEQTYIILAKVVSP
ncbi:DUF2577 domain-containing protein [Desulfosporosinus sp. PR]|uniref:DUF2577 domain-containing protein n=1 Tax=Candidatus Desulfosporosinus nitrosoreducens TaxID=3401928 RepID=UPI0027FA4EE5|nr:DUF2577 domain-containing protein [Desulfosporosinus sp. PR]MDQ7096942.1 DUF2577 domain-containing protein [Desulfosporosinus sp. PR]